MRRFFAVMILFTLAFASYGCGDSGDSQVLGRNGGTGGTGNVPQTGPIDVRVQVGADFPGAQQVAMLDADPARQFLRLFSSPAMAQNTSSFSLPGATVVAYGSSPDPVATATVDGRGLAHFDALPVGTYRFVVSNGGRVVLMAIGTVFSGEEVVANERTTAAALVALRRGFGNSDQASFDNILSTGAAVPEFNALVAQLHTILQGSTSFVSANGLVVQSSSLNNAITAANDTVPEVPGPPPSATGAGTNGSGASGGSGSSGSGASGGSGTTGSSTGGTSSSTGGTTARLTSITITAPATTVQLDGTLQMTASGSFSDGTTGTVPDISFTAAPSSTTPGSATVSGTGLLTGTSLGTVLVTAKSGSVTSNVFTVTVVP